MLGEKRFETINDLVADGLITMYVDVNAKDYIDQMAVSVPEVQPDGPPEIPERHHSEQRSVSVSVDFIICKYSKRLNVTTLNFEGQAVIGSYLMIKSSNIRLLGS